MPSFAYCVWYSTTHTPRADPVFIADMSAVLSEYERQRQRNIARNNEQLQTLGLDSARLEEWPERSSIRKRKPAEPKEPVRKSPRSVSCSGAAKTALSTAPTAVITPWEEPLLAEAEALAPIGAPVWEARRMHQHLTLSSQAHAVATTGVAGYGAALGRRSADFKQAQRWEVRAMRFGVGGFAVGVVRATMKPPFKSIGRSEAAVACYSCSGELSRFAGEPTAFGPPYSQGDAISVVLGAVGRKQRTRELRFQVNGAEVGRIDVTASEELVLAVQPYMGGVALRTA